MKTHPMRALVLLVTVLHVQTVTSAVPPGRADHAARSVKDGLYISWREHRIDDEGLSGVAIRGADGLVIGDLDADQHPDIISVHEDSNHIRIAFGASDPDRWVNGTLAEGGLAGAAEDADIGDVNGDGRPDIVAACEKGHVLYCQAPSDPREMRAWKCVRLAGTLGRGSWIRVKLADMDKDGRLDIVAANKGRTSFSVFYREGDPADAKAWKEVVIGQCKTPINIMPIDFDKDGDLDAVGGSRGEMKTYVYESVEAGRRWREHVIHAGQPEGTGFMMQFPDLNGDGRLDVVQHAGRGQMVWLEEPGQLDDAWPVHVIGSIEPDAVTGIEFADFNDDGRLDVFTGGYSDGPRHKEPTDIQREDSCGRLAWFEQPADPRGPWIRHDVSRRRRGMFDMFAAMDVNRDGLIDLVGTRGNSGEYDGVFWLEQVRTKKPVPPFKPARAKDSPEVPLPDSPAAGHPGR